MVKTTVAPSISFSTQTLNIVETKTCNEKGENMEKCQEFFFIILPRSWTGCGIVDCPEFVMIDTINGAVQSEINSQWLKMTKNVSFFGQKSCKRRLLQGVPTSFRPL